MRIKLPVITLSFHSVTLLLSLYYALVMNLPLYRELNEIFYNINDIDILFVISIPFFLFFALNILFVVFSWPKLTKPFFTVLILSSCLVCYSSFYFTTIFNEEMIKSITETYMGEAVSYLNPVLIAWFIGLGVLPCVLLWRVHFPYESWRKMLVKKLVIILGSVLGLFIIAVCFYQNYVTVGRNNGALKRLIIPSYYVHSVVEYLHSTYFYKPLPYKKIGLDAQQTTEATHTDKPTLFVFILGETARSQNFKPNGYQRETTPYTDKINTISFENVHSCGTDTALSVPCMFSRLNRTHYNERKAYHQDNLTDILNRAGIDVLWKENDGADKGVPHHVTLKKIARDTNNPLCNGIRCLDMVLLNHFEQDVASLKGNRFIVLHQMGSHGPTYYQRYPSAFAAFKPTCMKSDIENCSAQEIINTYDNSIRYTDYMVAQTISKLKKLSAHYNTALLYVSDHGESLGENGLYLHGMPYTIAPDYQKKVPMLLWVSPQFAQEKHLDQRCLQTEAKQGRYSHDNLFDSILGIMDVKTRLYHHQDDIFSSCRHSSARFAKVSLQRKTKKQAIQ